MVSAIRKKYDEEFKKNTVKLSHASPKGVKQVADDLGIAEALLYRWRKRYTAEGDKSRYWKSDKGARDAHNDAYRRRIGELFEEHRRTYGPDRLCGLLRRNGHKASYKKVQRIMIAEGLVSIHCRRRCRSLTNSKKSRGEGFLNLVKGLSVTSPFQVLSSDISYIRTGEGFEYRSSGRCDQEGAHALADTSRQRISP